MCQLLGVLVLFKPARHAGRRGVDAEQRARKWSTGCNEQQKYKSRFTSVCTDTVPRRRHAKDASIDARRSANVGKVFRHARIIRATRVERLVKVGRVDVADTRVRCSPRGEMKNEYLLKK